MALRFHRTSHFMRLGFRRCSSVFDVSDLGQGSLVSHDSHNSHGHSHNNHNTATETTSAMSHESKQVGVHVYRNRLARPFEELQLLPGLGSTLAVALKLNGFWARAPIPSPRPPTAQ